MKNLKLLFSISLLLLPVFSACKDDDNREEERGSTSLLPEEFGEYAFEEPGYTVSEEDLLPVKIVWVNGKNSLHKIEEEFAYDDLNRLIEFKTKKGGIVETTINLSYDTSGNLEEAVRTYTEYDRYGDKAYITYTYENNLIHLCDLTPSYGSHQELPPTILNRIISAGKNGRVSDVIDEEYYRTNFFAYSDGGNISFYRGSLDGQSVSLSHTYDDKRGIFSAVNTPHWFMAMQGYYPYLKNNKLTDSLMTDIHEGYEYQYNEQGFPVSCRVINYRETPVEIDLFTVEYIPANVF